jgi:molybdopterin molybdotransferase
LTLYDPTTRREEVLSVREALDHVVCAVAPLGTERAGLLECVGRVLGEDVRSERDVPGYANSAMDGYAVHHADLARLPARLRITATSSAGSRSVPAVGAGEAIRIMTGAPLPPGADSVVRVEDTRKDGDVVIVEIAGTKGSHIRHPGEDVRAGDTVLRGGRRLGAADIGLASSVGRTLLLVHRRPSVAILSTGDELVEADEPVASGQVVNSNAYMLAAAVREAGAVPLLLPIARDSPEEIRRVFEEAARADTILSTGGVSVGDFDFVKKVMDDIGVQRLFWKVAQKPGKPLTFGMLAGRPYFGLPGNPVSSLVCFYLYARPALRRMEGHSAIYLPTVAAKLTHELKKAEGLTEFVRCRLERTEDQWLATSSGNQSSAVLSSMSRGDGLVIAPAGETYLAAGRVVRVLSLGAESSSDEAPF